MFGAFALGLSLLVTGAIGYDVRNMHGLFQGGRWIEAPIWGQVALGIGFVLLGIYWFRRLGRPRRAFTPNTRDGVIRTVGRGKTAAAAQHERRNPRS